VAGTTPGKAPGLASRSADCSSYLLVHTTQTVTPATATATTSTTTTTTVATITSTVITTSQTIVQTTVTTGGFGVKRDYQPVEPRQLPGIPAYASPCLNAAAYVAACSCLGVSVAPTSTLYTTLPTLTATVTVTQLSDATASTTTTAVVPATSTVTVDVPAYEQVGGPFPDCGILHYDDWVPGDGVANDESNVAAGTDFCIQQCNARPNCNFFYQQWQYGSYWACWLANDYKFSTGDLQCGLPTNPYGVAYAWQNDRFPL